MFLLAVGASNLITKGRVMSVITDNFFRGLSNSLERKKRQMEESRRLKDEFNVEICRLFNRIQPLFANTEVSTGTVPHTFFMGEERFDSCALQLNCDNRSIIIEPQSFTDDSSALVTGILKVSVSNPDRNTSYHFLIHWKDRNDQSSDWCILANDVRTGFTIDGFIERIYPFSE
ncbi:hypothetical protein ACUVJH_02410 [Aeromonas veronii]|uniref:hypothetical protein n=1 Tax=Aeromonas veronii TaxID=654 RepID=UPI00405550F0